MKILITGISGHIGDEVFKLFQTLEYDVIGITRKEVDLTDTEEVDKYLKDKKFDVIIHCANVGGRRFSKDLNVIGNNIKMFTNIMRNYNSYDNLINFTSGAELKFKDDKVEIADSDYGLSKQCISYIIDNSNLSISNIRLYNCFGINEGRDMFMKTQINRYINREPMIVFKDCYFDFFYIEDLKRFIFMLVNRMKRSYRGFIGDLVYNVKYRLTDICDIINQLDNYKVGVRILENGMGKDYMGDMSDLKDFKFHYKYYTRDEPLDFLGIRKGIEEMYNQLKEKK